MRSTAQALLLVFTAICTFAAPARAQVLEKALAMVPEDAVGVVVVPSLMRLNADLTDMLERSGRSEAVIAGRPVDMLAAQLGLSAAFDDRGSFLAWWAGNGEDEMLVFAVPVADADRFLNANLTREEAIGPDAWRWGSGEIVHARSVDKHVLLSGNAELVRNYQAGPGIGIQIRKNLGEQAFAMMESADVSIWTGADGLREMRERGTAGADVAVETQRAPGMSEEMARQIVDRANDLGEGLEEVLITIDSDALAMAIKTVTIFDPDSALGKATVGGPATSTGSLLGRLPPNPYYFAVGADISGLGGVERFVDFAKLASIDDLELPEWVLEMGSHLQGIQFAVYPSKLGLAMGGVLNNAAMVVETSDPAMAEDLLKNAVIGFSGDEGMIRRKTTWTNEKKLSNGTTAQGFSVKESLLPKSERPEGSRSGDWAMQKMINGMVFGSRGMQGLAKQIPDGLVLTFSQRPDVFQHALDAASGGEGLSSDSVITAMRGWMLKDSDVEAFIDIGRIGKLVNQIAKIIPGASQMTMPIPESMPPIGFSMSVGDSRVETATILPSEIIGAGIGMAMRQGLGAR